MPYPNKAAWQPEANSHHLHVRDGPTPAPSADEIVIKVAYVAINPSEWKFQDFAYMPVPYPHVLGSDAAGTVVEVGANVKNVKVGDRVIGHCKGLMTAKATDGAFQHYATIPSLASTRIPDSLPFANAVVLPLSLNTAATGLYVHLGLTHPTKALASAPSTSVVVIWGASSSCGSSAVQLAVASGAAVVATASTKNFDYVKNLVPEAKRSEIVLVDHSDPQAVEKIIEAVKQFQAEGKEFKGAYDLIHGDALGKVVEIRSKLGGGDVPTVMWPQGDFPENVKVNLVISTDPVLSAPELGKALWHEFLPSALEEGRFLAKPDPIVVEGGLDKIQDAIEMQRAGVSARKIVVKIQDD